MQTEKPWYMSRTIWGALVAVAASIGSIFGWTIAEQDQASLADVALQIAGALGALFALYGRMAAKSVLH